VIARGASRAGRSSSETLQAVSLKRVDRVAIFESYVWENAYGNLRYIGYIFKYLDRSRFMPLLLVPRRTRFTDALADSGGEVISIPAPRPLTAYNKRLLREGLVTKALSVPALLAYNLSIARTLRQHHVSVLQCHNVRAALMAGLGARLVRCPVVLYIKTMLVNPRLDRLAFMFADKVLFQNQVNLDACSPGLIGRYQNKVEVLCNGVDLEETERAQRRAGPNLRKTLDINASCLNLVCLATLSPYKGLDYLLEAMAIVHNEVEAALYLIGTDEQFPGYKKKLETFARDRDLKVFFMGYRQDPLEIVALMDALVLPSLHEDAPRSVMEAMALSKPVVATRVGGLPSMVENGLNGFLVEARNSAALADAISTLGRNLELRLEMGKCARRIAGERYSLADNIRGLERIYMRLCEAQ
jgi:glycosyltransferase involved in cell wall biosynthesis